MLKGLFRLKKKMPDVRFLDYEVYRAIYEKPVHEKKARRIIKSKKKAPKNTGQRKIYSFNTDSGAIEFIFENRTLNDLSIGVDRDDYLDTPILVSKQNTTVSSGLSLGVFSDTSNYTAFIKAELANDNIAIKHFNHPNSFQPDNYPFFDTIPVWMIYLSEHCDTDFLTRFIERYIDKPTLFLCPNTDRTKTKLKIRSFLSDLESQLV